MKSLQEINPEQAAFFIDLFQQAKALYEREDHISVVSEEHMHDSWENLEFHMDVEMVRLGFEFGRMYERLGGPQYELSGFLCNGNSRRSAGSCV